eukprot:UN11507
MLVFFLYTIAFAQIDIGDSLSRSYTKYVQLPRSMPEAVSLGWQKGTVLTKIWEKHGWKNQGLMIVDRLRFTLVEADKLAAYD